MKPAFANRGNGLRHDSPGSKLGRLAALVLASLAFVSSTCPATQGLSSEERSAPNIVVILADDKYD